MKKKKNKFKNIKWIILFIIIAAIIIFFVIRNKDKKRGNSYIVEMETVSDKYIFAGIVDAERRVDLGFASGGRVTKNNFREGDFVKKGQLIAELDQSIVRANLVQANANYQFTKIDTVTNLNNSSISYDDLKKEQDVIVNNLRQQYISGDLQAYLDDSVIERDINPPTISGSYTSTDSGSYVLDIYSSSSTSGFSYHLSGLENGTFSGNTKQPARLGNSGLYIQFSDDMNYKNTVWVIPVPNTRSTTYLSRKTAYENALAQRNKVLADAKNNLNKLTKENDYLGLSYNDARIKNAQAQINASTIRLSDGRIYAPFDGYVVKNDLELGETVQAFISHVTLFSNNKKKLVLNTPEIYINKIHVGDSVSITLDAYPEEIFYGQITKIDDVDTLVDGVPVYETEVVFNKEDDRIRVGMNAHAEIIASKKEDIIAIPKYFILEKGGVKIVNLNKNGEILPVEVGTGIEGNDGLVEVVSGLSIGDIISPIMD